MNNVPTRQQHIYQPPQKEKYAKNHEQYPPLNNIHISAYLKEKFYKLPSTH